MLSLTMLLLIILTLTVFDARLCREFVLKKACFLHFSIFLIVVLFVLVSFCCNDVFCAINFIVLFAILFICFVLRFDKVYFDTLWVSCFFV